MVPCKRNLIILGVCGGILFILGCVLGFGVFPPLVDETINKNVWLEFNTPQYARFLALPFPLSFKVYLYNITNLDDMRENGTKPIVEEVGPYVYDEYLEKKNIKYNLIENKIEYEQHRNFVFNPEQSAPYTEADVIYAVHVPMVAVQQMIVDTLSPWLPDYVQFADQALEAIFAKQTDPFLKVSVKQYLWDGVEICNKKRIDALEDSNFGVWAVATLVCGTMKDMGIKNIEISDASFKFSFMKYKNNTHDGRYVVQTGMDDVANVGKILAWQGLGYTKIWNKKNETECDRVHGWDSTIYPPHIEDTMEFDIYATDICRTSKLKYAGEMEYKGIKGYRFEVDRNSFASPSTAPENECYCTNETLLLNSTQGCQPDGFVDMNTCMGAPVLASFPHMLWADDEYYNSTIGQSRDISKHLNFVELEPQTGSPLRGTKMAQFNIILRHIPELENTTAMFMDNPLVIPLLWVDEGVELPDFLVDEIKSSLLSVLTILDVVTWLLIGLGIVFVCLSLGGLYYLHKKGAKTGFDQNEPMSVTNSKY